jgi:hypothetical protein
LVVHTSGDVGSPRVSGAANASSRFVADVALLI